ncbi:RNA 2',3'-cyclic phosphodiesterase [Alkalibacterium sp. 20]|uniref:RNA 2',3'-cyclic phosphodiesterase n=1 Tax=Alkalibacterium sp. 20 TaxID=1798803 RepID=UPI00091C4625|nr:RNA 2',3'-cyclic phosphodiesterase [Alkalibacterium sp. 20]OJF94170.1 hypothetical protein AX762_08030 [Alkalibacterium sp. 20]
MRVFIAIEIDEQTKRQLNSTQDMIKNYVNKGNFTTKNNFHVTLRYIGDVDQEEINGLKQAIDETTSKAKKFTLCLDTLGHFPRKKKKLFGQE